MRTAGSRLLSGAVVSLWAAQSIAATLSVTTGADSGAGSLRQALLDSNASAGVLDTIKFAIPGSGVHTITLLSPLPTITDPVVIDATTQHGYAGVPLIQIVPGASIGIGFDVAAGATTIRGFVMSGFGELMSLTNGGLNHIEANYLCTDPTGTQVSGGGTALYIFESDGNFIGGGGPAQRNLIAGCSTGIFVANAAATKIRGNYIGTDASGLHPLWTLEGIYVGSTTRTRIGGSVPGYGNLVSGTTNEAILVNDGSDIMIQGNLIGTDATGTQPVTNGFAGIEVQGLASGVLIGGSATGEGNLISGNWIGIMPGTGDVRILGNRMGTDFSGTAPLPNLFAAIYVANPDPTQVRIGGIAAGEGNLIAYNIGEGVAPGVMEGSGAIRNLGSQVTIRGNSMYSNGGYAIDNGDDGLSFNDPGDADGGANLGQNFPIVHLVSFGAASTTIDGTLDSTPSTVFDLDFYADPQCSPRRGGALQGAVYLGSGQVATGSGTGSFSVELPVVVGPAMTISATATDPDGNTSELSQRAVLGVQPGSGPSAGSTSVTVAGMHFVAGATVEIGGLSATDVVVSSEHELTATVPALPPGTIADVIVLNPDATSGAMLAGWLTDFADVPESHPFHAYVASLVLNGVTAGCGAGGYCPEAPVNRAQMAVFLLKGKHGMCYAPPPATGVLFGDVHVGDFAADWIEALATEEITEGCGGGNYCPADPVRRDQMAVFLLKAAHGSAYSPPSCSSGYFADVACPSAFADWIQELAVEQITGGCGDGNYCPATSNTRGQMAVFIGKTFQLP